MSEPPFLRSGQTGDDETYEASYLEYVSTSIRQYKHLADRPMYLYVGLRLLLIVASSILPALAAKLSATLPYVAAGVTVLTLLDTNFRWGEEWKHFRRTQMALERQKRDYEFRRYALAHGQTIGPVKTPLDNLQVLQDAVETLMLTETDAFFKFRVTAWKETAGNDEPDRNNQA